MAVAMEHMAMAMSAECDAMEKSRPRRWLANAPTGSRHVWKVLLLVSVAANAYMSFYYIRYTKTVRSRPAMLLGGGLDFFSDEHFREDVQPRFLGEQASPTSGAHASSGRRIAAASAGSAASASAGSAAVAHGPHQQTALLFLFNAILIGTTVLYLNSLFPWMQLSIALFVIGMLISLLLEGAKLKDDMGLWGESYGMWMDIDPHLLLFTMLPTLLAGDAMTIDTSVAQRVWKQCVYLAGPGVLISAMLVALFLRYLLNWTFLLSLVTSSILCATDPVAVVALLKELGASPCLTVQIQGESLLNDGTAIVLYTIAYDMVKGKEYDFADMMMFLVKSAIMALGLGTFLGYFFFSWIRAASDRFSHSAGVIQILLTMCAAYWSFVLAEGILKMSGVLATVACSLVLANHMWPHVVDIEAMIDFWHVLEHLGNIIIFVLGGALVGAAMVHIDGIDYLNLMFIYVILVINRGALIFGSIPLLSAIHKDKEPVTWESAAVMTWGGLRGAVGLALGMQVNRGLAKNDDGVPQITQKDADRVLFFVAGIAFLTTVINASTCPMLVTWLGITALPETETKLLHKFNQRLENFSTVLDNPPEVTEGLKDMLSHIEYDILASNRNKPSRTRMLQPEAMKSTPDIIEKYRMVVKELEDYPEGEGDRTEDKVDLLPMQLAVGDPQKFTAECVETPGRISKTGDSTGSAVKVTIETVATGERETDTFENDESINDLAVYMQSRFRPQLHHVFITSVDGTCVGCSFCQDSDKCLVHPAPIVNIPLKNHLKLNIEVKVDVVEKMIKVLQSGPVDAELMKVVNKTFLTIVNNCYWKQIALNELRPGSHEAELLFSSIRLTTMQTDLFDIEIIQKHSDEGKGGKGEVRLSKYIENIDEDDLVKKAVTVNTGLASSPSKEDVEITKKEKGQIERLVRSGQFHIACAIAILTNVTYVCLEELFETEENKDNPAWITIESFFTVVFFLEFLLKFAHKKLMYFSDSWNLFDFFLVILGTVGLVISFMAYGEDSKASQGSSESRVIRIARVLRTMRFLRLFRLMHAKWSSDKHVSVEVASTMKAMQTMKSFVKGHTDAQLLTLKYFCSFCDEGAEDRSKVQAGSEVELARCLLQSHTAVYNAVLSGLRVHDRNKELFRDIHGVLERKHIVEDLQNFIEDALSDEAISLTNAGSLLHPLHHEVTDCIAYINKRSEGIDDDHPLHALGADVVIHGHHVHIDHTATPDLEEEEPLKEGPDPERTPEVSTAAPEDRDSAGGDAGAGATADATANEEAGAAAAEGSEPKVKSKFKKKKPKDEGADASEQSPLRDAGEQTPPQSQISDAPLKTDTSKTSKASDPSKTKPVVESDTSKTRKSENRLTSKIDKGDADMEGQKSDEPGGEGEGEAKEKKPKKKITKKAPTQTKLRSSVAPPASSKGDKSSVSPRPLLAPDEDLFP